MLIAYSHPMKKSDAEHSPDIPHCSHRCWQNNWAALSLTNRKHSDLICIREDHTTESRLVNSELSKTSNTSAASRRWLCPCLSITSSLWWRPCKCSISWKCTPCCWNTSMAYPWCGKPCGLERPWPLQRMGSPYQNWNGGCNCNGPAPKNENVTQISNMQLSHGSAPKTKAMQIANLQLSNGPVPKNENAIRRRRTYTRISGGALNIIATNQIIIILINVHHATEKT